MPYDEEGFYFDDEEEEEEYEYQELTVTIEDEPNDTPGALLDSLTASGGPAVPADNSGPFSYTPGTWASGGQVSSPVVTFNTSYHLDVIHEKLMKEKKEEQKMPGGEFQVVMPAEAGVWLAELFPGFISIEVSGADKKGRAKKNGARIFFPDPDVTLPNTPARAMRARRDCISKLRAAGITHLYLGTTRRPQATRAPRFALHDEDTFKCRTDINIGYGVLPGKTSWLSKLFSSQGMEPIAKIPPGHNCVGCGAEGPVHALHRFNEGVEDPTVSPTFVNQYLCATCITVARGTGMWRGCNKCKKQWKNDVYGGAAHYCELHTPDCHRCSHPLSPSASRDPYREEGHNPDFQRWSAIWQDNHWWCWGCRDAELIRCSRCERWRPRQGSVPGEASGIQYCGPCHQTMVSQPRRIDRGTASACSHEYVGVSGINTLPFGVEIEAHFDTTILPVNEYHSLREAPPPIFSHWRAERDGSIHQGGEIISPVLRGTPGAGEVLATMATLREIEATVTGACGQHIHVASPVGLMRVQTMTAFLEDLAFALTGSFRRWGNQHYAARVKHDPNNVTNVAGRYGIPASDVFTHLNPNTRIDTHHDRAIAWRTQFGTIEYRYPPGTLNGTQFILNHGFVHLLTSLAEDMEPTKLSEILQSCEKVAQIALESNPQHAVNGGLNAGGPWVHDSIKEAARFLVNESGWKQGGRWEGMAYRPARDGGKKIVIADGRRSISREISLPKEQDLLKRIERQLTSFYVSAHRISGWWSEKEGQEKAQEVMKIFA